MDAGQLVSEFQRECHVVRKSIDGDLVKVGSSTPSFAITCSNTILGEVHRFLLGRVCLEVACPAPDLAASLMVVSTHLACTLPLLCYVHCPLAIKCHKLVQV